MQRWPVGGLERGRARVTRNRDRSRKIVAIGGDRQPRGAALGRQHFEKRFEMLGQAEHRGHRPRPPVGHFGKRASGRTFSTGADGAGGFQNARNAAPPSTASMTIDNEPYRQLSHAAAR